MVAHCHSTTRVCASQRITRFSAGERTFCNTSQIPPERYRRGPTSGPRRMPPTESPSPPAAHPVSGRAVAIMAAGVARLIDISSGCGEIPSDLGDSAADGLEPPEHAAISVPGGERGGESGSRTGKSGVPA